jgi:hypothetical protein
LTIERKPKRKPSKWSWWQVTFLSPAIFELGMWQLWKHARFVPRILSMHFY